MEEQERSPLFTSVFTPNGESERQMYVAVRKWWMLAIVVLCGGAMLYLAYRLIEWTVEYGARVFTISSVWLILAEIAALAFLLIWELLSPRRFAKKQWRRALELHGTVPTVTGRFYEDEFTLYSSISKADIRLTYDKLSLCLETKDLFVLRTREKQLIALDKSGFTGIDAAGFRAFMDEKCPNAKRRWSVGA